MSVSFRVVRVKPMTTTDHHLNDYTISKLAKDAEISTSMIRLYEQQGILSPVRRTECGYRVYDEQALVRLRIVQAEKAAGISVADLVRFMRTVDDECQVACCHEVTRLQQLIATKQSDISRFKHFIPRFVSEAPTES